MTVGAGVAAAEWVGVAPWLRFEGWPGGATIQRAVARLARGTWSPVDGAGPAGGSGRFRRACRAQTETLGYIFVFSLITLTVGTGYALGVPALEGALAAEQSTNVERAFEVFDDNVDDLADASAPSRVTEIKLPGGTLAVNGTTTVTVRAVDTANASRNATYTVVSRRITYRDGDGTAVAYDAGALVRADGDAAAMRSAPDWLVGDERTVLQVVSIAPASDRSAVGGHAVVLVTADRRATAFAGSFAAAPARVDLTVNSTYAGAWAAQFDRQGLVPVDDDPSDGSVTYRVETDRLYVSRVGVSVGLST